MIEKEHPELSVRRQAELMGVNRNRLTSAPKLGPEDLASTPSSERISFTRSGLISGASCGASRARQSGRTDHFPGTGSIFGIETYKIGIPPSSEVK